MPTPKTFITTDRQCDQCEYNLKGLPTEGKCPECGTQIRRRTKRTSGTMSQEAPTKFVKKLNTGFTITTVGMLFAVAGLLIGIMFWVTNLMTYLFYPMSPKSLVVAGIIILPGTIIWVFGISIVTAIRPDRDQIIHDSTLDNDRFRLIVRLVSIAWPIYALADLTLLILVLSGSSLPILSIPLSIIVFLAGMTAWIGLIPTSIYFAELGYWASHDHLAQRLRGVAWTMAVFGMLTILLTAISATSGSLGGAASFVRIFVVMALMVAFVIFIFTVVQLGSVMKWVIKHQKMAVGSANRVRERIERDIESPGVINTGLVCRSCKYDLDGLPYGGRCPECGESYAEFTPLPTLDPATMYTRAQQEQSEVEIEIEAGDNKGIYFNQELDAYGKPKAAGVPFTPEDNPIPDEGDIPLFDNSDDSPENEQTSNGL